MREIKRASERARERERERERKQEQEKEREREREIDEGKSISTSYQRVYFREESLFREFLSL